MSDIADERTNDEQETVQLTAAEAAELTRKATELESLQKSYKAVQRELNKARSRGSETKVLQEQLNGLHSQMGAIFELFRGSSAVDEAQLAKASQQFQQTATKTQQQQVVETWKERIEDALDEYELEWDDPALADARKAYDEYRFADAEKLVYRTYIKRLKEGDTVAKDKAKGADSDPKEQLKAIVAEVLQEAGIAAAPKPKVDNGQSTVPSRRGRVTREQLKLGDKMPSYAELVKQTKELKDQFYRA